MVTKIGALRSHSKIRVVQEGHAYLHAHVHHFCHCWKPLTCGYVCADFFFTKAPILFWTPLTGGYVAAGVFFKAPIFLEAFNLWVRCRRRFLSSRKMAPIFLEAPNLGAGSFSFFLWPLEFTKKLGDVQE